MHASSLNTMCCIGVVHSGQCLIATYAGHVVFGKLCALYLACWDWTWKVGLVFTATDDYHGFAAVG